MQPEAVLREVDAWIKKAETVKSSVLSELARRDYVPKFLSDDYGSDYKRV